MAKGVVQMRLLAVLVVLALLSALTQSARAETDTADGDETPAVAVEVESQAGHARETEPAVTPTTPPPPATDETTDDQEPQPEPTISATGNDGQATTDQAPGGAGEQSQPTSVDNVTAADAGSVPVEVQRPLEAGFVFVEITDCEDPARVGQTDFFVFEDVFSSAAADSAACSFFLSNELDHQYTLIGISVEYSETSSPEDGGFGGFPFLFFDFLQPGTYQLRSDDTGAVSPVFAVHAGGFTEVRVYEYLLVLDEPPIPTFDIPPMTVEPPDETPIIVDPDPMEGGAVVGDVSVCRDESRPGDTEFRFLSFVFEEDGIILPDGGDTNVPGSIGALCRRPAAGEFTIILTNVVTGEQRSVATEEFGGFAFLPVPAGLYTLTEAASGDTSTIFAIREFGGIEAEIYLLRSGGLTATAVPTKEPQVAVTVPPGATEDVTEELAATQTATDVAGVRVTTLPATGQRSQDDTDGGPLPLLLAVSSLGLIGAAVLRRRRTA